MHFHELRTGYVPLFVIIIALVLLMPCAAHAAPPAAPTNLTATTVSATQILLAWTDNSNNEQYFFIEVKDAAGVFWQWGWTYANVTSVTQDGLEQGTTYTFRITAFNADGRSYSNEASATTSIIPAPIITSVSALSKTEIAVQWTDTATNIMQYWIEVAPGPDGPYMFQANAGTTSFVVNGLSPNTEYSITMRSMDFTWTFSPYSNEARATTMSDITAPVLQVVPLSSKRARLTWTDPTNNETAYYVEYRSQNDTAFVVQGPLPANTITYTVTSLEAGGIYTFRVRSYLGSYYGPYSNEVTVTTGCTSEGPYLK